MLIDPTVPWKNHKTQLKSLCREWEYKKLMAVPMDFKAEYSPSTINKKKKKQALSYAENTTRTWEI